MKVILKADIKGVGKKDEVINASDGYARNFLFPKNLAVEANAENMSKLKAKKDSNAYKKSQEKEEAKKDMGRMLDYIDKLNELDTTGVEPMSHVFTITNVFREDVVTNGDNKEAMLANAPKAKEGQYQVPKTIG